jgi:hypothetical protein
MALPFFSHGRRSQRIDASAEEFETCSREIGTWAGDMAYPSACLQILAQRRRISATTQKDLLRHSDIGMTLHYGKTPSEDMRRAHRKIAAKLIPKRLL